MSTPSAASHPSRRRFLGATATALAAATLSRPLSAADNPTAPTRNPFIYRFNIGDIEAYSISDGHSRFRDGLNLMWPETARPAMRQDLLKYGERTDALPLYINILVIKVGNETAVFDAGFGRHSNPALGWFAEALQTIGIRPESVTHAFLSHAHVDHLDGFVLENRPFFPQAALHCLKAEVDFWRSPSPDFSRSKRAQGPIPGMIKSAREKFDVLQPNLELHQGEKTLLGGAVTIEPAPGHTAGHAAFRIRSGAESLFHFSDVAHHHLLMFTDPRWGIAFDHEPDQAVDTRKKVFAQLAATRERAYGFHLPWPGIGRVLPQGAGYTWAGERWSWGS